MQPAAPEIPSTINTRMISKLFIDTNVFIALMDKADSTHEKAVHLFELARGQNRKFITSSDIIGETLTVSSMKLGKEFSQLFMQEYIPAANEIFITPALHKETRQLFASITSKNISFIDCSSVVAMKHHGIDVIFSFDTHFRGLGVKLLSDVAK